MQTPCYASVLPVLNIQCNSYERRAKLNKRLITMYNYDDSDMIYCISKELILQCYHGFLNILHACYLLIIVRGMLRQGYH